MHRLDRANKERLSVLHPCCMDHFVTGRNPWKWLEMCCSGLQRREPQKAVAIKAFSLPSDVLQ